MQLADLALGHGHQPHAGEGELLEQAGRVLLVAAQTVQRLGDHHLASPSPVRNRSGLYKVAGDTFEGTYRQHGEWRSQLPCATAAPSKSE